MEIKVVNHPANQTREIKVVNHPANQTSCYVHYVTLAGEDRFTEYFATTREATNFARHIVFVGEARSAAVIKPQVTYVAA